MRLTPQKRLELVKKVYKDGQDVTSTCRNFGISRYTFYKWAKLYRILENSDKKFIKSTSKPPKVHPRSLDSKRIKLILDCVLKNPSWSTHKISEYLSTYKGGKYYVSNRGVHNVLKRNGLHLSLHRQSFAKEHRVKSFLPSKLTEYEKYLILEEYLHGKSKISQICQKFKISRFTFYAWLNKYNRERTVSSLTNSRPKGSDHHRALAEVTINRVLNVVSQEPHLSVHNLHRKLGTEVGHHGIQNILAKNNLNTIESRISWSKAQSIPEVVPSPVSAPIPPRSRLIRLLAHFATIPKLGWFFNRAQLSLVAILFLGFYFFQIISAIVKSETGSVVGMIIASISLTLGLFFFLYSLKYYLTILMVLRVAQVGSKDSKITKSNNSLHLDLDKVILRSRPFVSIHVAVYNEKRVIERLLAACSSQEWYSSPSQPSQPSQPFLPSNYEVIIVDDSNDETTDIALQYLKDNYGELRFSKEDDGTEIYKTLPLINPHQPSTTLNNLPQITFIHRQSRSGFKGGALREALRICDKRAEYILVFDADFVPYPDTIEQFVKTFQATTTNDERLKTNANTNEALDVSPLALSNRIAAVQGYQWHVLNKSETWVTRGVRTEYAGSYVIERAGEEIYGGLKQIAGSVYAIRADVLRKFGWGTSITEDFELTLRLYEAGYKVVYTPFIQAPAEAVSTIKKLIRQRMRWAEGASFNVKTMFSRMFKSPHLTTAEKLEFAYLAPYYLQAAFFVVGTISWFLAEVVLQSRLPFWTAALGWSLVFTNLLSLPLMNIIGLFLEESDERDYLGVLSFIALSYIVVPFQAYAAIKGFLEDEEGPWFRTPKTGMITDVFGRSKFNRFFGNVLGKPALGAAALGNRVEGLVNTLNPRLIGAANPIKPRHISWLGNLALVLIVAVTVLMSIAAPLIPQAHLDASAQERKFATLTGDNNPPDTVSGRIGKELADLEEITEPTLVQFGLGQGKNIQYIFHREPRVRTKFDNKEIEMELTGSDGLGQAHPKKSTKGQGYIYEEIFESASLHYTPTGQKITEELILEKYHQFETIDYELTTIDLEVTLRDGEIHFAPKSGGLPLSTFQKPFMYEQDHKRETSFGIEYRLEKKAFGYKLQKVLTEDGKKWLADPVRHFPIVIDPTAVNSLIQAAISGAESDYGSPTRTMSYFPSATDGAAWYVVDADGGAIVVEKCLASNVCDNNGDWTVVTSDLDQGTGSDADTDNLTPSMWKEGNTLYVAWFDNSRDTYQFNSINTASSDALSGTVCNGGADIGTLATAITSIAVADDGDVYIAQSEIGGTNDAERVSRIATGACTETDITTSSGFDQNDRPEMMTIGNNAFLIFVADNGLRASVYVDDGTPGWDTSDADVNGATANNTTTDMSAVTDGTDLWIMQRNGTTGDSESFRCAACPTTSQTFTDIAEPWGSGLTATTFVGLSYLSTPNQLVAAIVDDPGSDSVLTKTTDADTISWGSQFTFAGGGVTEMDNMAMTANVASDDQVAVTFQDATNSELEFSTLPENLWLLLGVLSFLPKMFGKLKNRKNIIKK